ncbi:MAG TPA: two-component regulator propeller domain-containing protein, partial [Taishania sp.]|nr:two-component regulator propeller domain-containing protein [Taishania sp.]
MLKARYITLTIILLLTEVIYSQQHHFVKKDLEIPSQEAYNIYQDSQGYIWFSTMRGLCRYSGSKIKIFDKTTGLPESAVYTLTEDKKGTIWILTKNNHILYYKGGEFHEPEFSKKYHQIEELGLYNFTFHLRLIENDTKLALLTYKATYIIDIASGDIEKIHSNVDPYGTILEFRNYQTELIQTSPTLYTRTNVLKVDIKNPSNQTEIILNKLAVDDNQLTRVALTKVVESKRYFTFANTLFCHDTSTNQTSSFRCSKRIIGLYSDKSNGIWVGIVGGGLYYFSDGDLTKTPIHSLKDYSVSGICETTDGSIWVTTLEKGVFHSKSKHILTYHDLQGLDKIADALIPYNNHYIFTSSTTNATLLNKHEIIQLDIKKHFAEPIMAIHDFNGYKYITS